MNVLNTIINSDTLIIDTREKDDFKIGHIKGSGHVIWKDSHWDGMQMILPPRGTRISIVVSSDYYDLIINDLEEKRGLLVENRVLVVNTDFIEMLERIEMLETGPESQQLWRISDFLSENIDCVEDLVDGRFVCDLASGTGRECVHLAQRGWRVIAVDRSTPLLEQMKKLAKIYGVESRIQTVAVDLESESPFPPFALSKFIGKFDMVHVCRYLHRPLIPWIRSIVKPGGCLVYSTFLEGASIPRRPQYKLKSQELLQYCDDSLPKETSSNPYLEAENIDTTRGTPVVLRLPHGPLDKWSVVKYDEFKLEDGRPVAGIVATKTNIYS